MTFRITNSIMQRGLIERVSERKEDIFLNQRRISSGNQFDKASENPLAAHYSLALRRAISFHDRIQENARTARDMNNLADAELGSAGEVLQRARELSLRAASEALNEQQIDGVSAEAVALLERLTDIANATEEGKFIFGGFQTGRPPFSIQKNLVVEGTATGLVVDPLTGSLTNPLGLLNQNNFSTRLESRSMTTLNAGSFSLNGGDLLINGIDIGSFSVIDTTRSSEKNAQTLVDLINSKLKDTGVKAVAINMADPDSRFDDPFGVAPAAPPALLDANADGLDDRLTGIALATVDTNGKITNRDIEISGNGFKGAGGLDVLRRETLALGQTRLTTNRIAAGAIGNVAGGTVSINGIAVNAAMTFAAGNTQEDNARVIANALNSISGRTEVFAGTDGNGFLTLTSQVPFEVTGAPAQLNLANTTHRQATEGFADSNVPIAAVAANIVGGVGDRILINGVDIGAVNFPNAIVPPGTSASESNANALVAAINAVTAQTGVTAESVLANVPAVGDAVVALKGQHSINVFSEGNGAQLNITNGIYNNVSSSPVATANPITLSKGSLVINGIDIFHETTTLDAVNAPTAVDRARALVRHINLKAQDTGIMAFADSTGQLHFGNLNKVVTDVVYSGDTGERQTALGRTENVALNMSGDEAFTGTQDLTRLFSGVDIAAAGFGSGQSTAPLSFNAADTLVAGQFVINGTNILAGPMAGVPAADAATMVAAINAATGATGVSAVAFGGGTDQVRLISNTGLPFNLVTTGNGTRVNIPGGIGPGSNYINGVAAGDLLINGVDIGPIAPVPANPAAPAQNMLDNANALATAINGKATLTGVNAEVVTDPLTGGTRLLLKAPGQDIRVSTNNGNQGAVFNAIGIRPGTEIKQKLSTFEALIKFRGTVMNTKFNRDAVETISQIHVREIDDALTAITGNRVELGIRSERATLVESRIENNRLLLEGQLAQRRGTDIPQAISELTQDEQVLQAALALTSRTIGLSLVNFL